MEVQCTYQNVRNQSNNCSDGNTAACFANTRFCRQRISRASRAGERSNNGENEQLDATSNDVPEGAKISSRQASENILRLFPLLKKQRSHLHDSIHLIPIHRQTTRHGRLDSRLHKAIIHRDSVGLYMQAQGKC